ncbi:SulP family inorganic anion transporter [Paenibacillus motobuensis]|uniref:SulP family inorganic anion transporter n=1 Tax=Paenibacillus motobuensis TaxID=295324 RepID=A0ABP3IP53_9BACL
MNTLFTGIFKKYSLKQLQKDFIAGIVVGVIAIPLAMSFAIASGVKPEYGIYTACIAGILISLFGGSKFQIGGPTGAFVPILLGVVLTYGYQNLLIAGILAGIILCLLGIFKLGSLIKFIPRPVTVGFTSGIAVIIFTGQIANFLGLTDIEKHETFIANMKEIVIHIGTINMYSVITAVICLAILIIMPRVMPRIPAPLVGIIVSSLIAGWLFSGRIPTIGSTFGVIPSTLPKFQIPSVSWDTLQLLIGPAFAIAMLGAIESLLSAVVADGLTNTKHNSNRELIGQGIANIITPLFGGIPATGAIARTAANVKSGATSKVSGVIHGIFVLLTLLLLAPLASRIPLASMAPILMIVAWNMSERAHFKHILKMKSGDSLILVVTFLLTVLTSLTIAVEVGLGLALLLFTKKMSESVTVKKSLPNPLREKREKITQLWNESSSTPTISVYTVEGPLFFGAAQDFHETVASYIKQKPKFLILRMGNVPFIDTTGEAYFRSIIHEFKAQGGKLLIAGLPPHVKETLVHNGLYYTIGGEHFFEHVNEAITYSVERLKQGKFDHVQSLRLS